MDESETKRRAALMSVMASTGLALLKLAAGLLSGSLALVSEGAHNALDIAASGLTYFAVRIADKPAPLAAAPRGLAPVGARVLTAVLGKSKLEAMSPAKMEMAEHFWYVNWSKATAELGFAPRRPEATLRDTVADIRRNA